MRNIYAGTGNSGTLVGSSSSATTTNLGSYSAVKWTFAGGLSLVDNSTYTATLNASAINFSISTSSLYPNGALTTGSSVFSGFDTQFEGNFSELTPVPEPLTLLGATAAMGFGAAFKRRSGKAQQK